MPHLTRLLAAALAALCLACAPAAAQNVPPARPSAEALGKIDTVRATLEQIDRATQRDDLIDSALHDLRERLAPLDDVVQEAIDALQPQLDEVKARLEQLGPKPAEKAPPEPAEVAADRVENQKQFNEIDGAIKRARLLLVQIEQSTNTVASRRRALFTRALFSRSFSMLSPDLWSSALAVLPGEARAASFVTSDWLSGLSSQLAGGRLAGFLALTGLIAAAFAGALRLKPRVAIRDPLLVDPGEARKALAAVWTMAVTIVVPVAAALAFSALFRGFGLSNPRMEPFGGALFDLVVRISVALGAIRALLAPGMPAWRLAGLGESQVDGVRHLVLWIAIVLSISKIGEAIAEIIIASLPVVIVWRGLTALTVALLLGASLRGVAVRPTGDECLGPVVVQPRDWTGMPRMAAWTVAVVIVLAACAGYVAFAAFLTDQVAWVAFIGALYFLVGRFARELIAANFRREAAFGRTVMASAGLGHEALSQIAILLSGLVTLGLSLAAAMLALAPWGIESNDMPGNLRAAFFGFKVGEVTISLSSIVVATIVFAFVMFVARGLQGWLENRYLPATRLDTGLRNSIRTSVGYIGFILALSFALGYLGLSFDKLAIVAGALSVGIGFGLQSIVNNFVSGLILLWERAIRVGDWVVVGDEQGYVRRINVRSTEIETFDRATMIVPNSNLVSGVVKNWVRNDSVGRIKNSVAVNIAADPEKVRDALLACAREHPGVLKDPAPSVMFVSMTDNMLRFDLVSYVGEVERSGGIRSDLNFAIFKRFGDAGLDLMTTPLAPPPSMTGLKRAEALMERGAAPE